MANDIAVQQKALFSFLSIYKARISQSLPATVQKYLTPERLISLCATATARSPEILNCDHLSILNSIVHLAQLGLEPRPRQAYLVAFGKQCTPIIDYRGLIELARRSGTVKDVAAAAVYEGDDFDFELGSRPFLRHKPLIWMQRDGKRIPLVQEDRGELIATWCVAYFQDGSASSPAVMSVPDINRIKKKSKAGSNGPWVSDYAQMAIKSAVRLGMNLMPQSGDYQRAADLEDDAASGALPNLIDIVAESVPEPPTKAQALRDRVREKAAAPNGHAQPAAEEGTSDIPTQRQEVPDREDAAILWENAEDMNAAFRSAREMLGRSFGSSGTAEFERIWKAHAPIKNLQQGANVYRTLQGVMATLQQLKGEPAESDAFELAT